MALFLTHARGVSGAEIVLAQYLRDRSREHEVLVLSSGAAEAFFAATGVATTTVPVFDEAGGVTRNLSPAEAVAALGRTAKRLPGLARAIHASDHDVLVTNSMKAHALVTYLGRSLRRPVGIRLHDILSRETSTRTARFVLRGASHAAVSTAAVSQASARAAREIGMVRVAQFYNGVELPPPPDRKPSPSLRLLAVSQLARWKGIHQVLDALALARRSGLEVSLDIVGEATFGDEGYGAELRDRASKLDLSAHVRWHGRQHPGPFYADADVFIHLPDAPDPLPTAVIEAQAWALPVIASRSGGIEEIVADDETGFLVLAGDSAHAARLIVRLTDEGLRRRFGQSGRDRVRGVFCHQRYVESFDQWISSLSGQRRSGRPNARARWFG